MRTHPVDKLLEQHWYKSAAGLLQLVRFYVYIALAQIGINSAGKFKKRDEARASHQTTNFALYFSVGQLSCISSAFLMDVDINVLGTELNQVWFETLAFYFFLGC